MIDFLKFYTDKFDYDYLHGHEDIKWRNITDDKSGILLRREGRYKCVEFVMTEQKLAVKLPAHRLYNSLKYKEEHNYNRFTFNDLNEILTHVQNEFELDFKSCKITRLEFGFNLKMEEKVADFIEQGIIYQGHHGLTYPSDEPQKSEGYLKRFNFYEYEIKCYDKGRKHKLEDELFRFEIKIFKSRRLCNKGICTVSDLFSKDALYYLFQELVAVWNGMLVVDTVDFEGLDHEEGLNLLKRHCSQARMASYRETVGPEVMRKQKKKILELAKNMKLDTKKRKLLLGIEEEFKYFIDGGVGDFTYYISGENPNYAGIDEDGITQSASDRHMNEDLRSISELRLDIGSLADDLGCVECG
jgi:hypothetical protein